MTGSQQMWSAYNTSPDTYSTTIKILDENDNVLSITTSINRTNDVYYNNTYTYTAATHNDTGSRK